MPQKSKLTAEQQDQRTQQLAEIRKRAELDQRRANASEPVGAYGDREQYPQWIGWVV